jgi:lysophospholipase L1-like esterase
MMSRTRRGGRWAGLSAAAIGLAFVVPGVAAGEPAANSAVTPVPRTDEWWVKRNNEYNTLAKQGNVDLVFLGDSITEHWAVEGKEIWQELYAPRKAVNLGISGDRTQHVLWRLDHGNVDGLSPKLVVLMIGTNNSNGQDNTAEEIADGIVAIVKKLRDKLPESKVLLLAIFPRSQHPDAQRAKVAKASQLASKIADGKSVYYLDIGQHFLNPDGTISPEVMPDFLHLTPKGYRIWAEAIEPKLRELLGETATRPVPKKLVAPSTDADPKTR